MLIKLRQPEIEEALQMYMVAQGISLEGKTVDIAFTAGRGDTGLTADLDILSVASMAKAPSKPVLRAVEAAEAVEAEPAAKEIDPPFEVDPVAKDEEEEEAAIPAASAVSLFS